MAKELTLNGTLAYADTEGANASLQVAALIASVATKRYTQGKQNIGIAESAINLGQVAAPAGHCSSTATSPKHRPVSAGILHRPNLRGSHAPLLDQRNTDD